jgi:23S rRNA (pseudouridine1915-N3)-methyltransferase
VEQGVFNVRVLKKLTTPVNGGKHLHISILAVGRLKERYLTEAQQEYMKRLRSYARVVITEVADEGYPEGISSAREEEIKEKEARRLQKHAKQGSYTIALDREGKQLSSEELAGLLDALALQGKSDIAVLIGGSLGLSRDMLTRADCLLSFSKLTFPHQLMRIILLEQVYRAFKIIKGEPYHR